MVTVQMRRDVSHVDDDDQKTIVPYSQSLSLMREHERGFLLAGEKTVRLSGEYFQLTLTVDAPSQGHACTFAVTIATPHKKTGNIYGITIPYCVTPNWGGWVNQFPGRPSNQIASLGTTRSPMLDEHSASCVKGAPRDGVDEINVLHGSRLSLLIAS
ncbi:hypothetical protein CMEL01_12945 [Colletotrichum melonis]|uniref:Uncharacterized protein n=1 Tax=Colletotrichum melonis TaxID=1209925 RepID=A0AAI9UT12_9PEZI|nr:hypothetical protein CMEL01_12945 [Colletotrichum melonis]